jgi:hypothetical protein
VNAMALELIERVAKMVVYEVPHAQIAQALGLDEDRVKQIVAMEVCKDRVQQFAMDTIERSETLNDAWDMIEAESAGIVLQQLRVNPDADLALRAANIANKAQRRGTFANKPIEGNAGARAVIELHATYVDKLQQNFTIDKSKRRVFDTAHLEKKATNFLEPARVEKLLHNTEQSEIEQDVETLFDDFAPATVSITGK